jgi:UrcA family protein
MTKLKTALVALAAAATLAPAALADDKSNDLSSRYITVRVQSSDLDLNSLSDAQRLLTRIEDAARDACHDPRSAVKNMEHRCREQIVEANVERLNINMLNVAFNEATIKKMAMAQ